MIGKTPIRLYVAVGIIYAIHAVKGFREGLIVVFFLSEGISLFLGLAVILGIVVFWPLVLGIEIWSPGYRTAESPGRTPTPRAFLL